MAQRGERAVESWCARAVERYDAELLNHFEAEEQILFPAVREAVGVQLVDALTAEHRQMEALIAQLRIGASRAVLEEFLELLRAHIRREENELFEAVQNNVSSSELDALSEPLKAKVIETCLNVGGEES